LEKQLRGQLQDVKTAKDAVDKELKDSTAKLQDTEKLRKTDADQIGKDLCMLHLT
jgi:hypothetical protein